MKGLLLASAPIAALSLPGHAVACGIHPAPMVLVHSALPDPLPAGAVVADVEAAPDDPGGMFPYGMRVRVRRMIQGDAVPFLLLRARLSSCHEVFGNGRAGFIIGIPDGSQEGMPVVTPIFVDRRDGARLLAVAAAAQTPTAEAPPLPDQRSLYRILFADIHHSLRYVHAEIGFSPRWTQGYDVNISQLSCAQDGRSAVCRFRLVRTADGTPRDLHSGSANNELGCRAELRYARGPDNAPEGWRVRSWPGPGGTAARSTMRCNRDRPTRGD